MTLDTEFLEAFSLELAGAAAKIAVPLFRSGCADENKAPGDAFDPVTEADRGAEAAMRRLIAARFPDHGVIGEEYGEDRPRAEFVWVLDPVDGTRAFISGLPLWTTLIALRREGRPLVGAVAVPALGEVFVGGPAGARRVTPGGVETIRTRAACLDQALIATTDPALFGPAEADAWGRLRAATRLARLGCDAYAYAMVAAGRMDLVAEVGLKPWDWSAPLALIRAAGGAVTDWSGGEPDGEAQILAAGDAGAHAQALRILAPAAA